MSAAAAAAAASSYVLRQSSKNNSFKEAETVIHDRVKLKTPKHITSDEDKKEVGRFFDSL